MTEERLRYLLECYAKHQCSEVEILELNEWFHAYNPGVGNMEKWFHETGGKARLSERSFEDFNENLSHSGRQTNIKFIIRSVAAILLFISSIAILIYCLNGRPVIHITDLSYKKSISIRPGGNRAVLTLANGKKIVLDNTGNGHIARQNNMQINKVGRGSISYETVSQGSLNSRILYNTMTTPRGGKFTLILADGTEVTLDAASSIVYPVAFTGKERRVEISGQAYFKVVHNANKPFIVSVKGQTVQDIGTAFNISAYDDDPSVKITLAEGLVDVWNPFKKTVLYPGLQAEVENGQSNISVKKVDVEEVTSWKSGWFVFHNETLKSVMKQASRWYDVEVEYEGKDVVKKFGGTISRYKDISELLENLKLTGGIHYKIEERRVILIN